MTHSKSDCWKDEPKWTPAFMEQFAREWLKHDILLPDFKSDGMSQYAIKALRCAARREMFTNLQISRHRPWQKHFLTRYKRMISKMVRSKNARTLDEALASAPPWVREFEPHFGMAMVEEILNKKPPPPRKSQLLEDILKCLWRTLRELSVEGLPSHLWTKAIASVATELGLPSSQVFRTWLFIKKVALQKLRLLQVTGDKMPGDRVVGLSAADWVAVDLILVYDSRETLLDQDGLKDYDQLSTLTTLFSIAQLYKLDEWLLGTSTDNQDLWEKATQAYIQKGFSTSMVVLQRRWYELVQLTRDYLTAFQTGRPLVRRYESSLLEVEGQRYNLVDQSSERVTSKQQSKVIVPPLCRQLAIRFPALITQRLPSWAELVTSRRLAATHPAHALTQKPANVGAARRTTDSAEREADHLPCDPDDDDEIILIEQDIETIDLEGLDSEDEDRLIIDERLKRDKINLEHRNKIEEMTTNNLNEECKKLNDEVDEQLKFCLTQKQGGSLTSSIDWSLFNQNNTRQNAQGSQDTTGLDRSLLTNEVGKSLQTEVVLNDYIQENLKDDPEAITGNKNSESVEKTVIIDNAIINENINSQQSSLAVLEQLDLSNVEARIIFSDDEDDCNDNFLNNISNNDNLVINQAADIQNNQDEQCNQQIIVKTEDHLLTTSTVSVLDKEDEMKDADDSNRKIKMNTVETVEEFPQEDKDIDKTNTKATETNLPKKRRVGPKSFMEKCEKEEKAKKKRIGPKWYINNLERKRGLSFESDEQSLTISKLNETKQDIETVCKKEVTSDDEESNLVIAENDKPQIKKEPNTDVNKKNVSSKLCFEQDVGDEMTDNIVLHCNTKESIADTSQSLTIKDKTSGYSSEIIPNKETDIDPDANKTEGTEQKVTMEDIRILQSFSLKSDNTESCQIDNDKKPIVAMEIEENVPNSHANYDEHDLNMNNEHNYNKTVLKTENTEVHFERNDSRIGFDSKIDTASSLDNYSKTVPKTENTEANNERSDSRTYFNSEMDNNSSSNDTTFSVDRHMGTSMTYRNKIISNLRTNRDKLLSSVRIHLYRIDQLNFWKKTASQNTINITNVDNNMLPNPQKRLRLKPGLRPRWTKPVKRLTQRSYKRRDLRMNPDFAGFKNLDVDFVIRNGALLSSTRPITVDLERLPLGIVEGYLEKQHLLDRDEHDSSRVRKKVELSDIEEVRRINSGLLTAQVKPLITGTSRQVTESGSDTESTKSFVMELETDQPTITSDAGPEVANALPITLYSPVNITHILTTDVPENDNTLSPEDLDEVLKKLKKQYTRSPQKRPRRVRDYCCPARHHINYNRARARIAARALRNASMKRLICEIDLHARAGASHAQLSCGCCCLSALRGLSAATTSLAHDHQLMNNALHRLATNKLTDPQPPPNRKSKGTEPPTTPAQAADDLDDSSNESRKETGKRKSERSKKKLREKQKIDDQEKKKRSDDEQIISNEYDEWMRQRSICNKYFTLSGSNTSKRSQNSVTTLPTTETPQQNKKAAEKAEEHTNKHNENAQDTNSTTESVDTDDSDNAAKIKRKKAENELSMTKNGVVNDTTKKEAVANIFKRAVVVRGLNIINDESDQETKNILGFNTIRRDHNYIKPIPILIKPIVEATPLLPNQQHAAIIEIRPITKETRSVPPSTSQTIDLTEDSEGERSQKSSLEELCQVASLELINHIANQLTKQNTDEPVVQVGENGSQYAVQAFPPIKGLTTQPADLPALVTKNQPQSTDKGLVSVIEQNINVNELNSQHISLTQPQIKALIESAACNPGWKYMRAMQSPNVNETVVATCEAKPDNPNNVLLQILTQHKVSSSNNAETQSTSSKPANQMNQPTIQFIKPESQLSSSVQPEAVNESGKPTNIVDVSNPPSLQSLSQSVEPTTQMNQPVIQLVKSESSQITESIQQAYQSEPVSQSTQLQPNQMNQTTQPSKQDTKPAKTNKKVVVINVKRAERQLRLISVLKKNNINNPTMINKVMQKSSEKEPIVGNTEQCVKPSTSRIISSSPGQESGQQKPSSQASALVSNAAKASSVTVIKKTPSLSPITSNQNGDSTGTNISSCSTSTQISQQDTTRQSQLELILRSLPPQQNIQPSEDVITKKFNRTDLSNATPQYVEDLVKYIQASKMLLSEVQILSVNTEKPLLKIKDSYLVVTDVFKPNTCGTSFWTLNPPMQFNEIYFKKPNESPAKTKQFSIKDVLNTGQCKNVAKNDDTNKARLKVKAFAKLPGTENALTMNEDGGTTSEVNTQTNEPAKFPDTFLVDRQDTMYIDNKCFKKLSDYPLIYAQVFLTLTNLLEVEELVCKGASLYMLSTRGLQSGASRNQRCLFPLVRRVTMAGSRNLIDLSCPGAKNGVKELVRMLNSLVDESGNSRSLKNTYLTFTSLDDSVSVRATVVSDVIQLDSDDE